MKYASLVQKGVLIYGCEPWSNPHNARLKKMRKLQRYAVNGKCKSKGNTRKDMCVSLLS